MAIFDVFVTRGGRFTEGMGKELKAEVKWIRDQVIEHHVNAGPLIRQIKDNSAEIERLRNRE